MIFSHTKRGDVICSNVDGTGNYQITKPGTENQHHVSFPCAECAEASLTDVRAEKLIKREHNCTRVELAASRKNCMGGACRTGRLWGVELTETKANCGALVLTGLEELMD